MISPGIEAGPTRVLVVRAGRRACALPLGDIRETMRPLPVEKVAGLPEYVRGMAVIRGEPTPVVDLGAILDGVPSADCRRFVTLRCGDRTVALAVGEVCGLHEFGPDHFTQLPSLLGGGRDGDQGRDGHGGVIGAVGVMDSHLVLLLRAGRILPDGFSPGDASGPTPETAAGGAGADRPAETP